METKDCFSCGFNQIGTLTLMGTCWGWLKEKGGPMEIKATKRGNVFLVDAGCSRWTDTKQDFAELKKPAPIKLVEEEL